ncbi:murein hydrolase activator EnvC family protein [Sphingomonas sp. MS122]|uniref:murein hydrolase activator EnvC family protein n=1 Tax=Sphingomonas sp. MS122 TaxID=3412683 RepID=UPI003C30C0DE
MSALRIVGWTVGACAAGVIVFLAATIRVIEPQPEAWPVEPPSVVEAGPAPAFIVPVQGIDAAALHSNWGEARGGGTRGHQGLDIMAPAGTPVLAAVDGTVEKLYFSKGGGGVTLYQRAAGGRWMLYYAHLSGYAPRVAEGRQVRAGETLAYVGDTGNAGAGNYHLHFAVARMAPGEGWWQGTPVDPYPLLAGARPGG